MVKTKECRYLYEAYLGLAQKARRRRIWMKELGQKEYQDYRKYQEYLEAMGRGQEKGVTFPGSDPESVKRTAGSIFASIMGIAPSPLENLDGISDEEFENHPVKKALKALRVNEKRLVSDPVTRENCYEKIAGALNVVVPGVMKSGSIKAPYVENPDGLCEAIVPGTFHTVVPQRPAWYKRWFTRLSQTWKKEVEDYQQR